VPDSGEYHPRRWSRQWEIVNLKRKEGKDENKRKSKPYEKITNGEKQIVESKNGEEWRKRKESAGVDEKNTKPDRETGARNGGAGSRK